MQDTSRSAPKMPSLWVLWLAVWGFGALVNLLMLTSPLFMLQVYDRVLPSQSTPTLLVLLALVAFLFASMAAIDAARARLLARIGAALSLRYEGQVFSTSLNAQARASPGANEARSIADLDAIRKIFSTRAVSGVLDAPWSIVFIGLLFVLHPAMGALAFAGSLVLLSLAVLDQWHLKGPHQLSRMAQKQAQGIQSASFEQAAELSALGMGNAMLSRWLAERRREVQAGLMSQDRHAAASSVARALRLFLQSAMLALGAWLVLHGQLSAGLMVASSILMGRVLSPVEQLATQWMALRSAWSAWGRLRRIGRHHRKPNAFPQIGKGALVVSDLLVGSPDSGVPLLRVPGFQVLPGQALGVIGPSGAGKTTLARSLIGALPTRAGQMHWGDVPLPLAPEAEQAIGYLGQSVTVLPGTIHDNIARFHMQAKPEDIIRLSRAVGLHDAVMALPFGYATELNAHGAPLSGGEVQRLGLARALYGPGGLVILDEPGAQLDAEGLAKFNSVIRSLKQRGTIVVVFTQRPAIVSECDQLLMLEKGVQRAFGPREEVLSAHVKPVPSRKMQRK